MKKEKSGGGNVQFDTPGCPKCGHKMRRTGTANSCSNCGYSDVED